MSAAFEVFAALLRARSGLELAPDHRDLLAARLVPLARRRGLASLEELAAALRTAEGETLAAEVSEAMASADTAFFRDRAVFAAIRDTILPRLVALGVGARRLRLWSAGCATGQEPYSLAMLLDELGARLDGFAVELVATDLSERFLEKARSGLYSQFEVQRGLPVGLLLRHFARCGEAGDRWQLEGRVRSRVDFRRLNLLEEAPELGAFDLILCRNVLARFAPAERAATLQRLIARLAPGGTLVLGAQEAALCAGTGLLALAGAPGMFRGLMPELRLAVG